MRVIRALCEAIVGSVIILAVAYGFLVSSVPHAEAGEGCRGQLLRASWYGQESGSRTADGTYFDGSQLLVAHKTLPFGTRLRLTYRGRSIVVPVRDRGPFIAGRALDMSEAVAEALGAKQAGVVTLCAQRLN
jgi:rare lipoprotein A